MEIIKDLKKQLQKKGINIISQDYYNQIDVWKSWFAGNVGDFHFYNVKLADGTSAEFERKTMSMAKKGAEDMMKLNWSNKCDIKLGNSKKTKKLWKVLDSKQNNFTIMFPQMLEMAFALGTTCMSEYKDALGRTRIEYIKDASLIIPYSFDNFNITGLVTMDQWQESENDKAVYYTHLTYHEFKVKRNKNDELVQKYIKYNELYKSNDQNELGEEIEFNTKFEDVEEVVEYETDTPHFQIIKPPIANNLDLMTPMGISIYANSIDKLKAIDIKYDEFSMEYIDCKRRILVSNTALKGAPKVNEDGSITQQLFFDRNDRTFVAINGMKDVPVTDIAFDIRKDAFIDGIDAELNWYGSALGFGETFYKMGTSGQATATEILSEDSDAFKTKQTYETMIKDVIIDLVKSVCYLEKIEIDEDEIHVDFDYSRFENQEKTQQRLEREVENGIISKVEYRMKVYSETEEVAKQKIQKIEDSEPSLASLLKENNFNNKSGEGTEV